MRVRALSAAFLTMAVVLVAGCSDSGSGSAKDDGTPAGSGAVDISGETFDDQTASTAVQVEAVDNSFKPQYIEVKKGTTVTFTNDGRTIHNVLPADDDAFTPVEADDFGPGSSAEVVFDQAGEFPYYCSLHGTPTKGMYGGVKVVD
jgi:plastocyanin